MNEWILRSRGACCGDWPSGSIVASRLGRLCLRIIFTLYFPQSSVGSGRNQFQSPPRESIWAFENLSSAIIRARKCGSLDAFPSFYPSSWLSHSSIGHLVTHSQRQRQKQCENQWYFWQLRTTVHTSIVTFPLWVRLDSICKSWKVHFPPCPRDTGIVHTGHEPSVATSTYHHCHSCPLYR